MEEKLSRLLLALSGLALLVAGVIHARAFPGALAAVAASNLAPFYAAALKALWLGDSATLTAASLLLAAVAARPSRAARPMVFLVAALVVVLALLLYRYMGNFPPGHLLLAAATGAALGGMGLGRSGPGAPGHR